MSGKADNRPCLKQKEEEEKKKKRRKIGRRRVGGEGRRGRLEAGRKYNGR